MKKILYILVFSFVGLSLSSAASVYNKQGALGWYGYTSAISVELYVQDNTGGNEEDKTFRKRRHRRRRKIRPPKKGW
tara:strand:- start:1337 stop:1567 length:231 start_codon:yes stop_codon:yes gene_type:complete